ncbi:MAG: hypothetical protein LBQ65_09725 [Tannerellaceae bacterium]|jgi:hypothetical protein|nr:hypothetical protein [Tannerellaceae bacterium]
MNIYLDTNQYPLPQLMLPAGFAPELSRTNPFLTDMGSQSIPLTLPGSDHNLRLLGFLHRGTFTSRPVRTVNVIMQHGGVYMRGVLVIDSANETEGISGTFYTNEGQLYEKMNGVKMGDIEWEEIQYSELGTPSTTAAINWFKQVMRGNINDDYYIFPVLTDNDLDRESYHREGMKFILNETASFTDVPNDVGFVGEQVQTWASGTENEQKLVTLPVGYGITPFLKVSYVLRWIFKQFGYALNNNIFDTHATLSRLVLINNTADAICNNGFLRYKHLVPEQIEVMDFINIIRHKFGVEFIERNGAKIDVVGWNTVLTTSPDKDLSAFVAGKPRQGMVDPSNLTLKMNRSLTPFAAIETDSREALIAKYGEFTESELPGGVFHYTRYYYRNTGRYLVVDTNLKDHTKFIYTYISSSFWDHLPDTTLATETIDMSDPAVPSAASGQTVDHGGKVQSFVLPFIGGLRNLNTQVSMNNTNLPEEEETNELQPMLCYSVPGWLKSGPYGTTGNMYYQLQPLGGCFDYRTQTEKWGTLNLAATGYDNLFDAFYTHRDAMLRRGNQIVEVSMRLPAEEIVGMDFSTPKIINGMKVLIERIDFVLGRQELCRVTARTLHLFA